MQYNDNLVGVMNGRIQVIPIKQGARTSTARHNGNLTGREKDVVRLLLRGMSGQQIADKLGMRYYTVTTHIKHIYKKLGIHRRAELFPMALANGWLTTPLRANLQTRPNATGKKAK